MNDSMTYQSFVTVIEFSSYFFTGLVTHTSLLTTSLVFSVDNSPGLQAYRFLTL